MNPMKCAFGVTKGKFLGFIVHRQGIQVDADKQRAVLEMPPPRTVKQFKSVLGKVSYLRRFIPALAEVTHPLMSLLRPKVTFSWKEEHQEAFEKVKQLLTSPSD